MNSKQITELSISISEKAKELRKHVKGVRFIELEAVDAMQDASELLQDTVVQICEVFDQEDGQGFRKPAPRPLYDTLEEKAQALDRPHWPGEEQSLT